MTPTGQQPGFLKASHTEVRYGPGTRAERCSICRHFIAGPTPACESVKSPISPDGWCMRWSNPAA